MEIPMMKKYINVFITIVLFLILTACSSSASSNSNASVEPIQSQPQQTEAVVTPSKPVYTSIAIGEKITLDNYEVTLNNVALTYQVLPDNTSGYYSYYEADAGKVYIDVDLDIKNLKKRDQMCDSIMNVTADYNNGYIYTGSPVVDDADMGFNYANISSITPLETRGVHYLIDCPEEVETSTSPLIVYLQIDGKEYSYTVR